MPDLPNKRFAILVFGIIFFFAGGLKLYQGDLSSAIPLIFSSVLIIVSYFILYYETED